MKMASGDDAMSSTFVVKAYCLLLLKCALIMYLTTDQVVNCNLVITGLVGLK
jgi:hypothetical protein